MRVGVTGSVEAVALTATLDKIVSVEPGSFPCSRRRQMASL